MQTMTALEGKVREALARLNPMICDVVEGFWIRPQHDDGLDKAVVLLLVDFLDESAREVDDKAIDRSIVLCDQVSTTLADIIDSTCWFSTRDDFERSGPPLEPAEFRPLAA